MRLCIASTFFSYRGKYEIFRSWRAGSHGRCHDENEDRYAVAVRKPDHTIDVKVSTFKETIKNKKLRRLPFIRGVINFIESLILGMQTLMYSASFFEDDEDEKRKKEP